MAEVKKRERETEWNPSKHVKQTALALLVKTAKEL